MKMDETKLPFPKLFKHRHSGFGTLKVRHSGLSVSGFSRAFPLLAAASSSDTDGASGDDDTQQTQRHGVMLCTSDSVYVSRAGARGMQ